MKRRLHRFVGTLFAAGVLGGCAMPPSQTGDAKVTTITSRTGAGAPLAFGQNKPAAPAPAASDSKLADAKPIDESIPDISGFHQVGRASWYGPWFHGRRTASGERFNMHALTAAHKTLPLSSYVRVTNTQNDKTVVVKINDRGPYVRGRIIDLSYAAARELGLQHDGTAHVKIVGLSQEEASEVERGEKLASADTPKSPQ
ncbi:septal ring lytic transglycosylase RlpA family protein [Trinickia symbiotica]|uniref:Endolytic peptidoglycan transglycosylase RlpA n=1 Tax=Trinickia symbiotica TaxID=863227 RepID=A0A2N7WMX3_9BURK|nr:septal ring lytic transglycosylase RlpA family protein [Trinickia symbiotica]PMS30770.1 septal ring lytic transglycosylase RlpA family protein [Trinickia symbiotica]